MMFIALMRNIADKEAGCAQRGIGRPALEDSRNNYP